MDKIKSFFSPTTRHGRAIRTALQAFIGFSSFLIGVLSIPGLEQGLIQAGVAVQVGSIALWIGVVSYLWNALEALYKWLYQTS